MSRVNFSHRGRRAIAALFAMGALPTRYFDHLGIPRLAA